MSENSLLVISFLNELNWFVYDYFYTVKWFQFLLFSTNNSIQHYSFVCTQLNGSKYCYVSLKIQLDNHFVYTHLNGLTVLFLTIFK